jgi:hypothetical protein
MKDKHIERKLWLVVVMILAIGILAQQCYGQQNITKRTVTLDSLSSRQHDTIWLTTGTGAKAWVRISGDTLFLGDRSGEKYLGELKNSGSITSDTVDVIYINDSIKFLANGAFIQNDGAGNLIMSNGIGSTTTSITSGTAYPGHASSGIATGFVDYILGVRQAGFTNDTATLATDSVTAISVAAARKLGKSNGLIYGFINDTILYLESPISGSSVLLDLSKSNPILTYQIFDNEGANEFTQSSNPTEHIIRFNFNKWFKYSKDSFQIYDENRDYLTQDTTGLKLDRGIQIGNSFNETEADSGTLRYKAGQVELFNGTSWAAIGLSNDPVTVQIEVTSETLVSGGSPTYVMWIPTALLGMNLISMKAKQSPGQVAGDRSIFVDMYRNRGGTITMMTSTGATFSTGATINTTYDDVQEGDAIGFGWSFTGGTTSPVGLYVTLEFQTP